MKTSRVLPPTYFIIAIIASVFLHIGIPVRILFATPWNLVGILPLGAGAFANILADHAFHEAGTTVRPFERSSKLVTDGLFHISRNPMYLGFTLMLLGTDIVLGSLTPFVVTAVFVVLIDRRFVAVEERMLANRFGGQWLEYAARTRRWI